jgi:hypothetical protein
MSSQEVNVDINSTYDDEGTNDATESMQSLQTSVMTVSQSMMMMERESMMMMRYQDMMAISANNVANAQMTYNDAVEKYGASSEQAIRAHNSLTNAIMTQNREQQMLQMQQEMFILRSIPMMMEGIVGLVEAFDALDESENLAVGLMQVAASGAQLGIAGYTLYQATQMAKSPGMATTAPQGSYAAGGVVPSTGMYQLHEGETVGRVGGGGGGGDTFHISIAGAMNAQDIANQVMEAVEREKRRRYPVSSRVY